MKQVYIKFSMVCALVIASLQAAEIRIGDGTNGLNNAYMTSAVACSGASNTLTTSASGYNGCLSVTQGTNVVQRNYVATLFQNATTATSPSGTTITDGILGGGVGFNRIQNDVITGGTSGSPAADFWATSSAGTSSIVVPVGVYGVDKVWTMLNDYWGGNAEVSNIVVSFRWDDSSNGSGGGTGGATAGDDAAYDQAFTLTNGVNVRSAVACATQVPVPVACKTNNGSLPISTSLDLLVDHGGVTANNVFTDSVGNNIGTSSIGTRYNGQNGVTLQLDDQVFAFGSSHINEFLVSMTITAQISYTGSGYAGATLGTNNTRAALSAVTVSQATPEPSTVFLALTGLGALGYFRRRRV